MKTEVRRKLNDELMAPSRSSDLCLCIKVQFGDGDQLGYAAGLSVLGSQCRNDRLESLLHDFLTFEAGKAYCLTQIIHVPAYNLDLAISDPKHQPPQALVSRTRSTITVHAGSLALIQRWIQNCRRLYPWCRRSQAQGNRILPQRLLEISIDDSAVIRVRVRPTEDLHLLPAYVTLSHRWQARLVCLLRDNLDLYKAGIPLADLPQHFNDAIEVCWKL